ncbi:hypothetical protein [Streptomyces sp. NPDC055055]
MSTDRLSPMQLAAREEVFGSVAPLSSGQGASAGWGFGMAVRTHRGDYAPIGQFGWFGGTGTTACADRTHQVTGVLLTQVGPSTPDPPRAMNDFCTTPYQAVA